MGYEYEAHKVKRIKGIPWAMCQWCGLLYLNNDFSRWCVKMGCNNSQHPDYKKQR